MVDTEARTGIAAGVPYAALPPADQRANAPLVIVWHMMDAPRTEAAMSAALPLASVPAWRVYLGLPMFGSRAPEGGQDEVMRLAFEDYLLNLYGPVVEQAAFELPAAVTELRAHLPVGDGPIGLVGGSAGGAAALLALTEADVSVAAAALINPTATATGAIEAGERIFGVDYSWSGESRALAARLDFPQRVDEILKRDPQPAIIVVSGELDDPGYRGSAVAFHEAMAANGGVTDFVSVPDLAHPLADEPGLKPAPQTAGANVVDTAVSDWLVQHLPS